MGSSSSRAELPPCGICLQCYDKQVHIPKVLRCGHTVCQPCLQDIQELEQQNGLMKRCPSCRGYILFPEKAATNFSLLAMFDKQVAPQPTHDCDFSISEHLSAATYLGVKSVTQEAQSWLSLGKAIVQVLKAKPNPTEEEEDVLEQITTVRRVRRRRTRDRRILEDIFEADELSDCEEEEDDWVYNFVDEEASETSTVDYEHEREWLCSDDEEPEQTAIFDGDDADWMSSSENEDLHEEFEENEQDRETTFLRLEFDELCNFFTKLNDNLSGNTWLIRSKITSTQEKFAAAEADATRSHDGSAKETINRDLRYVISQLQTEIRAEFALLYQARVHDDRLAAFELKLVEAGSVRGFLRYHRMLLFIAEANSEHIRKRFIKNATAILEGLRKSIQGEVNEVVKEGMQDLLQDQASQAQALLYSMLAKADPISETPFFTIESYFCDFINIV